MFALCVDSVLIIQNILIKINCVGGMFYVQG